MKTRASFFCVFGGPLAWYLQLCAGYALASQPCFREGHRMAEPLPVLHWTWPAMIVAMLAAVAVALLALLASWRTFVRTRDEASGAPLTVIDPSIGRSRFLALWGVFLGSAFAITSALTAVAFITLPRCAG